MMDKIKEVEKELQEWVKQFYEKGSTRGPCNQLGDRYIVFGFACRTVLGIAKAVEMMKDQISEEASKTGIISIRMLPEITKDNGYGWKIVTSMVSYKGNFGEVELVV